MTRLIIYPIDLEQPYTIIKHNEDGTLTVSGIAKTIQCRISERAVTFGGHPCIFTNLSKGELLSKAQKAQLRWVKKQLGDKQHEKQLEQLCDSAITGHIYKDI
jgi:hypothetical protein